MDKLAESYYVHNERAEEINGFGKNASLPTQQLMNGVCERCNTMWDELPHENLPTGNFGTIPESKKELTASKCRMCRLLASVISDSHISDMPIKLSLCIENRISGRINGIYLGDEGTGSNKGPILLALDSHTENGRSNLTFLATGNPGITTLQGYLRDCENTHKDTCAPVPTARLNAVRFIDCTERKVVQMPTNCKFVALSYVWGTLKTSLQLEDAPATITDRISVALALGYRYLWVDRYVRMLIK